ncbi:MAG: FUSC family protein [Clostridia bacterium]|nr:FUSC family protein [Clostridia bacterium]
MRTVKTGVAVLLCMIIFPLLTLAAQQIPEDSMPIVRALRFLINRDSPIFACIASVIVMQSTVESSLKLGTSRVKGTIFGGLFGLLFLYIDTLVPHRGLNILLVTVGIVFIICFFNVIRSPQSTAIGLVTFLIIMITTDYDDPFLYAVNRIIDTAIGVAVSVGVNYALRKPKLRKNKKPAEVPDENNKNGQ